MRRGLGTRSLRVALFAVGALLIAHRADATMILGPGSASLYPTQSVSVTANLSGLNILAFGPGTLSVTGLPGSVTTVPSPVTYVKAIRLGTATATFQLVVGANAVAGTSTITVTDQTFAGGSANFTLTILEPKLTLSAGAGVVPGSYPANVHFNVPKTGQSGNVPVTVNVSAGSDFTLSAAPNPITIAQGQTGNVVISLNPLNGFNGTANCTIPAIQSITPNPNAFTVGVGKPTSVAFTVAANAAPGM